MLVTHFFCYYSFFFFFPLTHSQLGYVTVTGISFYLTNIPQKNNKITFTGYFKQTSLLLLKLRLNSGRVLNRIWHIFVCGTNTAALHYSKPGHRN